MVFSVELSPCRALLFAFEALLSAENFKIQLEISPK